MKRRLRQLLARHRHAAETLGEALTVDLLWTVLRGAGLVGAGAALAVVATPDSHAYHPTYSLSTRGAALVTRFEGVRYTPYNDAVGYCTTGVGHLIAYRPCTAAEVRQWTLTAAQATSLLLHDAATTESCVRADVTHPISQPQFDALVSFAFNIGCGGLASSAALRDVNAGDFADVTTALERWDTAGGQFLPGLLNRRRAEARLFMLGDYGPGIGRYVPPKPPTRQDLLRARTGYWSWLAWSLGEGPWSRYPPRAASVRPHVPAAVPHTWWRHEKAFIRGRAN